RRSAVLIGRSAQALRRGRELHLGGHALGVTAQSVGSIIAQALALLERLGQGFGGIKVPARLIVFLQPGSTDRLPAGFPTRACLVEVRFGRYLLGPIDFLRALLSFPSRRSPL